MRGKAALKLKRERAVAAATSDQVPSRQSSPEHATALRVYTTYTAPSEDYHDELRRSFLLLHARFSVSVLITVDSLRDLKWQLSPSVASIVSHLQSLTTNMMGGTLRMILNLW